MELVLVPTLLGVLQERNYQGNLELEEKHKKRQLDRNEHAIYKCGVRGVLWEEWGSWFEGSKTCQL